MVSMSLLCFPETGVPTYFTLVQSNLLCDLFHNYRVNEIHMLQNICNLEMQTKFSPVGGAICFISLNMCN